MPTQINNDFYDTLNEDWYTANDHPVALLRAENAARNPWILREIETRLPGFQRILDIGCGAGFLSNALALKGHSVIGIDLSEPSLNVAKKRDQTQKVQYMCADAYAVPFKKSSFDVVCAMDILEHLEEPEKLVQEASRVLRPGGLFFFHTFNRNFLSYVVAIKGVEWFVKNTPKDMHTYELFITPSEFKQMCRDSGLQVEVFRGYMPRVFSAAFWRMLATGEIPEEFSFQPTKHTLLSYVGIAVKGV